MSEFIPPFKERETEELIEIAYSKNGDWQEEAVDQAKNELKKRKVSIEYQNDKIKEWKEIKNKIEAEYQIQLEVNATKSYVIVEMVLIFIFSPFILSGRFRSIAGMPLSVLKRENFKLKYNQRLYTLISGIIFWIILYKIFI